MKHIVRKVCVFTILFVFLALQRTAYCASLTVKTGGSEEATITIDGEIDNDTVSKVIALADQSNIRYLKVNSGGGDVEAAMLLGRYIRKNEMTVRVRGDRQTGVCASACIFLLAAAVQKVAIVEDDPREAAMYADPGSLARVGVHKPFSDKPFSSMSESTEDYKRLNVLIKEYFEEMNTPASLLDIMNSVSSGGVRWLTQSESEFFFPALDPVYQHKFFSGRAAERGISTAEYIKREQRSKQECEFDYGLQEKAQVLQYIKCRTDIIDGLR